LRIATPLSDDIVSPMFSPREADAENQKINRNEKIVMAKTLSHFTPKIDLLDDN
jgi:hypothetical protein